MRGFIAKKLRGEARLERSMERDMPKRDLTQKRSGAVINHPYSIRAMYLALKRAYLRLTRSPGEPKLGAIRVGSHKKSARKPQPKDRIIAIENPLMLILQNCQPSRSLTNPNVWNPHPVYRSARLAADRGRGDLVKKMALQFLPA